MEFSIEEIKTRLESQSFENTMLEDISIAGRGVRGESQPPWEVLSLYVITLEERIAELEKANAKR